MDPIPEKRELQPLTEKQRAAIRACRFSTTTVPREIAWLITTDDQVVRDIGDVSGRTTTYVKDYKTMTYEHDVLVTHPEAIELVLEIMAERVA